MSTKLKPFILGAFILFCALPFIFKDKKNVSELLLRDDAFFEREPSLPVYPKGNTLNSYVTRVKDFYSKNEDKQPGASIPENPYRFSPRNSPSKKSNDKKQEVRQNNSHSSDEAALLFAAENTASNNVDSSTTGSAKFNFTDTETVNLNDGTVVTSDNLLLYPNTEGYVYNGQFFKNGTYPRFANRRYIEGALNRYHTKVAERIGKTAIYRKNKDGNLTVDYVSGTPTAKKQYNSPNGNTLLASNKFRDGINKYQGARINSRQKDSAVAAGSPVVQSVQDTYNILDDRLRNRMLGDFNPYKQIQEDVQNAAANAVENASAENKGLLDNIGTAGVTITNNPPVNENNYDFADDPENVLTILVGGESFSNDYSWAIHDMGCNTNDIFTRKEKREYNIAQRMEADPDITIALGTCKPVVEVTPSSSINRHIYQSDDLSVLRDRINWSVKNSNKSNVKVISTDRNTVAMINRLNEEGSIRNKNGRPVNLVAVGPIEGEHNLASTMENITNAVVEEKDKAAELNQIFNEYYLTTQLSPIKTMLVFPSSEEEVFVLNDPNNSYWLKNPEEINQYPQQYMYKDGVYYPGVLINKKDLTDLSEKERTNLLIVSDERSKPESKNGSVTVKVKEEDVNISSFYPESILRNSLLVERITEIGDVTADNLGTILRRGINRGTNNEQNTSRNNGGGIHIPFFSDLFSKEKKN